MHCVGWLFRFQGSIFMMWNNNWSVIWKIYCFEINQSADHSLWRKTAAATTKTERNENKFFQIKFNLIDHAAVCFCFVSIFIVIIRFNGTEEIICTSKSQTNFAQNALLTDVFLSAHNLFHFIHSEDNFFSIKNTILVPT